MKKINCILLVDDSPSTNFYHKRIIETSGGVENVYEVENGLEALDYICQKGKFNDNYPRPNVIFLDINMPKMDGFEFLESYSKLSTKERAKTIIVFLTASDWHLDKVKDIENDLVHDFIEKPLKEEDLLKINHYYQDQ